ELGFLAHVSPLPPGPDRLFRTTSYADRQRGRHPDVGERSPVYLANLCEYTWRNTRPRHIEETTKESPMIRSGYRVLVAVLVAVMASSSLAMPVTATPDVASSGVVFGTKQSKADAKAEKSAKKDTAKAAKEREKCSTKGVM